MSVEAMEGLTFGCDPELFVTNADGEFVTAAGLIPGTKEEPYRVPGGAVQVDGMAAEFNIDPVTTFKEFNDNIIKVTGTLKRMLPKGYKLSTVPSVVFSEKAWAEAPDEAKILGCNPDYNAWDNSVNPPPSDPDNPRLRTASGHVHIGWTDNAEVTDPDHVRSCVDLVKQLDWYLGPWSVRSDPDTARRRLYGKAGAMRFKPYGVEYRVLSNFWLTNITRREAMWNRMQHAIWQMSNNFVPNTQKGILYRDMLIESINESVVSKDLTSKFSFTR